jgi:hypothetical protein
MIEKGLQLSGLLLGMIRKLWSLPNSPHTSDLPQYSEANR